MFEYTKKKTIVNKTFCYGIRWVGTIPFIYSRNVKFFCRGIKFEIMINYYILKTIGINHG